MIKSNYKQRRDEPERIERKCRHHTVFVHKGSTVRVHKINSRLVWSAEQRAKLNVSFSWPISIIVLDCERQVKDLLPNSRGHSMIFSKASMRQYRKKELQRAKHMLPTEISMLSLDRQKKIEVLILNLRGHFLITIEECKEQCGDADLANVASRNVRGFYNSICVQM